MVLSMVGIDQETLLGFADGFYLECCTQNFYSRCVNEFRDDELYTLGKVTQAAGMSNKNFMSLLM